MHQNARPQRFIGDKGLQLSETPRVECCALRPPSPHPRANMRQIFDGNRALRAFGLRNNPFGENVVDVFSESGFLSGKDAQAATAPQRAVPLELVAQAPVTIAHVLDRPPAVDFPITIDGDVRHAQIDAQHIVNINRRRSFNLAGSKHIPIPAHEDQIAFAASERQQCALPLTTHEGNRRPTIHCPNRDR